MIGILSAMLSNMLNDSLDTSQNQCTAF